MEERRSWRRTVVAKEEAVEEEDVSIGGCCAVHRPSMDVGA